MRLTPFITLLILTVASLLKADDRFTVMIYNVENLFDADGVAQYSDYHPDSLENPNRYTPRKLLTKIQNIATTLKAVNEGRGPDIILFQEFERDFTPGKQPVDYQALLKPFADTTLDAMLSGKVNPVVADMPVEALVLKYFEDNGLTGYQVVVSDPVEDISNAKAHTNATFSRFPILSSKSYPTQNAREILVTTVNVDGSELILINNHWKSGASRSSTEGSRVANARDTRKVLESILDENPMADIIIGGDLNTYYNSAEYFPIVKDWQRKDYAMKTLGSQGDELAIRNQDGPDLYNLWFEVPPAERKSEFYQGSWGTLMQILITRGLYDGTGIKYVDNSFRYVTIPDVNVGGEWDAPKAWYFLGETGGGFSDHLPLVAEFEIAKPETTATYADLDNPSRDELGPAWIPTVDLVKASRGMYPDSNTLAGLSDEAIAGNYGELFEVSAEVVHFNPIIVQIGDRTFEIYAYKPEVRQMMGQFLPGDKATFLGELSEHSGKPQFVVHDESWVR